MAQDPRALLQKVCCPYLPMTLRFPKVLSDFLLAQADKTLSTAGGGFSLFGGKTQKYEDAADLYNQAANAFRLQKSGKEAGQAFEKAANIQTKNLNEPDDAANTLQEAYKAYRKTDPQDAARCLQMAIQHYTSKGNFRRAATQQQNLAEIYEVEIGDIRKALQAYGTAAEWFESDHAEAYVFPYRPRKIRATFTWVESC
jgi:alpha-soluble NSF attachment protein